MNSASDQERAQRVKSAEESFLQGKVLFDDQQHDAAFTLWAKGFRDFAPAFIESPSIQNGLKKLRRESQKQKLRTVALEQHATSILAGSTDEEALYHYFSFVFFEEGLSPECHDPRSAITDSRGRWRTEYEQLGEPLYARFRLALLDALDGKLDQALDGLQFCHDRFPPKKHESLRLKPLIEAVKQAQQAIAAAREGKLVIATPTAWEQAGFATPFESRTWKRSGIPPELAKEFREAGFTAKAAGPWTKAGFSAADAHSWKSAGVHPAHARRWHRAGLDPAAAAPWEKAFSGDLDRAVLFLKAGFADAEEARLWSEHFQFPSDAMNWRDQGFSPEQAGFWYHDAGVKDPFTAMREQSLLVKPDEES